DQRTEIARLVIGCHRDEQPRGVIDVRARSIGHGLRILGAGQGRTTPSNGHLGVGCNVSGRGAPSRARGGGTSRGGGKQGPPFGAPARAARGRKRTGSAAVAAPLGKEGLLGAPDRHAAAPALSPTAATLHAARATFSGHYQIAFGPTGSLSSVDCITL